jgi:hypothetical protein
VPVGAKKTKILWTIVVMQSVDVVNLQDEWLALPERAEATNLANMLATEFKQRPSDSIDPD